MRSGREMQFTMVYEGKMQLLHAAIYGELFAIVIVDT